MSVGCKRIMNPFTGHKKRKARAKYMSEEIKQNLSETDRVSYYNQEEWVEQFLDDKGATHGAMA